MNHLLDEQKLRNLISADDQIHWSPDLGLLRGSSKMADNDLKEKCYCSKFIPLFYSSNFMLKEHKFGTTNLITCITDWWMVIITEYRVRLVVLNN